MTTLMENPDYVNPLDVLYTVWNEFLEKQDKYDPLELKDKDNAEIVLQTVARTTAKMSNSQPQLDRFNDVMETEIVRGDIFLELGEQGFVDMDFFPELTEKQTRELFKLFSNYIHRFGEDKYYFFYQKVKQGKPQMPSYQIVTPFELRDHLLKHGYQQPKGED